jgi:hypothetical protein
MKGQICKPIDSLDPGMAAGTGADALRKFAVALKAPELNLGQADTFVRQDRVGDEPFHFASSH